MSGVSVVEVIRYREEYYRSIKSAEICTGFVILPEEVSVERLLAITFFESHDWEQRNKKTAYIPMDNTVTLFG